jgi:hypothetical protein
MENVTEMTAVHFQLKFSLFLYISTTKVQAWNRRSVHISCVDGKESRRCPDALRCAIVLRIND